MRTTLEQSGSKFQETIDHYQKELSSIRAGRANTKLVEDIEVMVYGQKMPMQQLANISVVDPTLLMIQPWDKSNVGEIKKAIEQAEIGINPIVDGDALKLPIPSMNEERRQEYVKLMKQKGEEAKISIRQTRKDVLVGLDQMKEDKEISEDEYTAMEKELQQKVDEANETIDKLSEEKEQELLTV